MCALLSRQVAGSAVTDVQNGGAALALLEDETGDVHLRDVTEVHVASAADLEAAITAAAVRRRCLPRLCRPGIRCITAFALLLPS
eukprot:SAG11_NODE_2572_length_3210_cov_18.286725_3_plen_85_part_00